MDRPHQRPLLTYEAPDSRPKSEVESNTVIVYKRRKRKCGCCIFCCKFLCIGISVFFLIIALVITVPYVKEAFAPVKTEVEWSPPHTSKQEKHLRSLAELINRDNRTFKARYNPFAHSGDSLLNVDNLQMGKEMAEDAIGLAVHAVKEAVMKEDFMEDTREHLEELKKSFSLVLPSSFDARDKWSRCSSVHQVTNQGACGSCWAMAATSVMSDRLCISTNFTRQEIISAQDLLSCCPSCGSCGGGGFLISAFKHWKERGLVTGGLYGSNEGCKPYQIDNKCGYPCAISYYEKSRTPKCERKCQPLYRKNYDEDLIKSSKAYWLRSRPFDDDSMDWRVKEQKKINTALMQEMRDGDGRSVDLEDLLKRELFLYGPVMGCLIIGEQFLLYDSGIFDDSYDDFMYSHCMKLIGWGEEKGVKYWTYANSWGKNWGENGFLRIKRSTIPSDISAGIF